MPNAPHRTALARLIFASRWLQLPIYLGLIAAQAVYAYKFVKLLWQLIANLGTMNETAVMLAVLNLIDVVMIANLLIMVLIGGYETFVSHLNVDNHPDQPEWLNHVNASRAESEAVHVHHQHFVHPPAANLYQRRQPAAADDDVAAPYPSRLPRLRTGHGVDGQNRIQHLAQSPLTAADTAAISDGNPLQTPPLTHFSAPHWLA